MLPVMNGPSPQALGTLAVAVAVVLVGAFFAMAALLGWSTLELICLLERYNET